MSAVRSPQNRVRVWTGTVHYATAIGRDAGRPACGAAARTASCWLTPTVATVTCRRCVQIFGEDEPGHVDAPAEFFPDDHARRRAAERAARRAREIRPEEVTMSAPMPAIHYFADSHEAYDCSQCYDGIKDGDVLAVPSERVTAILVAAWPTIVDGFGEDNEHASAFDGPLDHPADWYSLDGGKYAPSLDAAGTVNYDAPGPFFYDTSASRS